MFQTQAPFLANGRNGRMQMAGLLGLVAIKAEAAGFSHSAIRMVMYMAGRERVSRPWARAENRLLTDLFKVQVLVEGAEAVTNRSRSPISRVLTGLLTGSAGRTG
jgi:hypothetical protein